MKECNKCFFWATGAQRADCHNFLKSMEVTLPTLKLELCLSCRHICQALIIMCSWGIRFFICDWLMLMGPQTWLMIVNSSDLLWLPLCLPHPLPPPFLPRLPLLPLPSLLLLSPFLFLYTLAPPPPSLITKPLYLYPLLYISLPSLHPLPSSFTSPPPLLYPHFIPLSTFSRPQANSPTGPLPISDCWKKGDKRKIQICYYLFGFFYRIFFIFS